MSTVAIIWFLIGSGLMILGAFFLRRLTSNCSLLSTVILTMLPVALMICMAVLIRESEIIPVIVWGTVALNLGINGVVGCLQGQLPRMQGMMTTLWLGFGWLVCIMAGGHGAIGKFSGWSLIVVGLVAVWQGYWVKKNQINALSEVDNKKDEKVKLEWRRWLMLIPFLALLVLGTGLMIWCQPAMAVICGMPLSLCSLIVLVPISAMPTLLMLRKDGRWQFSKVQQSLTWINVLLITFGLGVSTVILGSLHLTQSVVTVVLPWVAGMAVLSIVKTYLPQKTARWWGGLIAIMFFGMIINLLW